MSLIEIEWKPPHRQLRQFAALCLIALPTVAWWWEADRSWIIGLASFSSLLVVLSWVQPALVKPVFVGCSLVAAPLGLAIGELAMLGIFVTVFCPLGLVFRLIGRDPLTRSIDLDATSYWQDMTPPKDLGNYYRQS